MLLLEEARDKFEMMEMRLKLGNANLAEMNGRKEDPWKRKDYTPQISLDPRYCTRLPELHYGTYTVYIWTENTTLM